MFPKSQFGVPLSKITSLFPSPDHEIDPSLGVGNTVVIVAPGIEIL